MGWLRSGSEHWMWLVVVADEEQEKKEEKEKKKEEATNIKSDNPLLAGGEKRHLKDPA